MTHENTRLVAYNVVTSEDDPEAQGHELLGTKMNYQERTEKGITIWKHALKQLEKALKATSMGQKRFKVWKGIMNLTTNRMQFELMLTTPW